MSRIGHGIPLALEPLTFAGSSPTIMRRGGVSQHIVTPGFASGDLLLATKKDSTDQYRLAKFVLEKPVKVINHYQWGRSLLRKLLNSPRLRIVQLS
jgi:hypothetical protein